MFTNNSARHYPRQEPSALAVHAGICAGGAGQPAFLPRTVDKNEQISTGDLIPSLCTVLPNAILECLNGIF
jgi:hypothetical protein